eukprot:TRINITY_DN1704_c0_g2_i1.p1 TRINITY_DN1704_c0_g2~~TRINITY_DN1704_c0_g2_i1.p1  ORF type:complete len:355 (-),score=48.40 TRINITY_DN1704_c0_g2_i1:188-1252(-)
MVELLLRRSKNGLLFVGELPMGEAGSFSTKMDHLVCFLGGTLALGATGGKTVAAAREAGMMTEAAEEDLQLAKDLTATCYELYKMTATGLAPERVVFNVKAGNNTNHSAALDADTGTRKESRYRNDIRIRRSDRHSLLRPETIESLFYLFRITGNPLYRKWGWEIFQAIERHARVEGGGYASLQDVTVLPTEKRDSMETYFMGETLKYLYLLFGPTDVLPLDKWVFNTEAHPIPMLKPNTTWQAKTKKHVWHDSFTAKSIGSDDLLRSKPYLSRRTRFGWSIEDDRSNSKNSSLALIGNSTQSVADSDSVGGKATNENGGNESRLSKESSERDSGDVVESGSRQDGSDHDGDGL